jgi:hypothetical protein
LAGKQWMLCGAMRVEIEYEEYDGKSEQSLPRNRRAR